MTPVHANGVDVAHLGEGETTFLRATTTHEHSFPLDSEAGCDPAAPLNDEKSSFIITDYSKSPDPLN